MERSKERINPEDVAVLYIQNTGKKGKREFIWGPLLKNEDSGVEENNAKLDNGTNQGNTGVDSFLAKSSGCESPSKVHSINLPKFTANSTPNNIEVSEPTTSLNNTHESLSSLVSTSPLRLIRKVKSDTKQGFKEIQDKIIQDRITQIIQENGGINPENTEKR